MQLIIDCEEESLFWLLKTSSKNMTFFDKVMQKKENDFTPLEIAQYLCFLCAQKVFS